MARDAEKTRQKILEAATKEFSQKGISGARVDNIAAEAGCNKAMLYLYYGNKTQLFKAVFDNMVGSLVNAVPFNVDNLPEYAGQLFDYYQEHPETLRLNTWRRMEKDTAETVSPLEAKSMKNKVECIKKSQEEKKLPNFLSAEDLLLLVIKISTIGSDDSPEGNMPLRPRKDIRKLVVDKVRRLILNSNETSD